MRRRVTIGDGTAAPGGGFSLVDGGPLSELARGTGLVGGRHDRLARGLLLALVGWLTPLLLATFFSNGARGVPLILHVQFLVAVPVFLWAERFVDWRVRDAVSQLTARGLVAAAEQPRFQAITEGARRLLNAKQAAIAIILLSFALTAGHDLIGGAPAQAIRATPAIINWYVDYVSLPLFRIVLLQWVWRWAIWVVLLARIARLPLRLEPTHPDRTGGLGFLEQPALAFSGLQVATAALLGVRLLTDLSSGVVGLRIAKVEVVAFGLITLVVTLGPLAFFARKLMLAKARGQLEFGRLASHYSRLFAERWLGPDTGAELPLGDPAPSSLADLGASYAAVDGMRLLPVGRAGVTLILVVCLLPGLPATLGHLPLRQALARIAKAVLP